MKLLLKLGAFTGARLNDCVHLRFGANVKLAENRITIVPRKTGKRSKVYVDTALTEVLRDELGKLPQSSEDGAELFPRLAGVYDASPSYLAKRIHRVFVKAGIVKEDGGKPTDGVNRRAEYGFHSFRYSRAAVMGAASIEAARLALGHSNETMTRSYVNGAKAQAAREREAERMAAALEGGARKADGGVFAALAAIGGAIVPEGEEAVYNAVCAMLRELAPETLRAVASTALKLSAAIAEPTAAAS